MRELGQRCQDVELTHDRLRHQVDLTTPATSKLSYLTAPTLEQHQQQLKHHHQQPQKQQPQHQDRHRAQQLERREAAVLQLVPPMVRRLRHLWRARRALPVAVLSQAVQGQQHHEECEHHHDHTNDKPHLVPLTRRPAHLRRPTGHASTSRHHYVRFAAIGTTSA